MLLAAEVVAATGCITVNEHGDDKSIAPVPGG